MGDNNKASRDFLDYLLPFLAQVVVQDGIFWIHYFKEHPLSVLLLNVMPPDYERWAAQQRAWINEKEASRNMSRINEFGSAAQASFDYLHGEIKRQSEQLQRQSMQIDRLVVGLLQNKVPVQASTAVHIQASTVSVHADARGAVLAVPPNQLRNTPLVPPIPSGMPNSMAQLRHEHETLKLANFNSAPSRRGWSSALKVAYNRRSYLYKVLLERARCQRNHAGMDRRIEIAAMRMDEEIKTNGMTNTAQYLAYLKERDPSRKSRVRRHQRVSDNS